MSIHEDAWRARGRALSGVPDPAPGPRALSPDEARRAVARRLRASLQGLAEEDYDGAVAAAAAGYLEGHRSQVAAVAAESPAPPGPPAPARPPPAPRPRVLPPSTPTTFTVTRGHALAKGLAAGRVLRRPGESAIAAVARRITADTRCAVLGAVEEGAAPGAGAPRTYRVTLRGHLGPRRKADALVEGDLWVTIRGAEGP